MKGKIVSLFLITLCLLSCKEEYLRVEGCHLDKMGIQGNVVKIETIVQSTIPLTELYSNAFDPRYVLSMYAGNICIELDNQGNVKRSIGYGMDGQQLFNERYYIPKDDAGMTMGVPIGPDAKQVINDIETVLSDDGQVINVKYYSGNDLIWNQQAFYNSDGTFNTIIKEYESLSVRTDYFEILYADTTRIKYLSYDSHDNWTEAEVDYVGILPKHAHKYKIKRQITYFGEDKKSALINELKRYNQGDIYVTSHTEHVRFGRYGSMSIPGYMAEQSESFINDVINYNSTTQQINYLFMSQYNDDDAYATFSVELVKGTDANGFDDMSPAELKYNDEMNSMLQDMYAPILSKSGVYILKWLPYQFVTISGKRALRIRYYRYGIGSPIPVYFETHSVPMKDGNTVNITYSFQSNLDYRFRSDFENAVNSVRFY